MITQSPAIIRKIQREDLPQIIAIDAQYGEDKEEYWQNRINSLLKDRQNQVFGFCALKKDCIVGYIWGEIRAWEFGSPPCGWIYSLAVHPHYLRQGIGLLLCKRMVQAFQERNISFVRTMVKKDALQMLRFFRSCGFQAGPFIEMELDISSSPNSGDMAGQ